MLLVPELAHTIRPVLDVVCRAIVHVIPQGLSPRISVALFCPRPMVRTCLDRRFLACPEQDANIL